MKPKLVGRSGVSEARFILRHFVHLLHTISSASTCFGDFAPTVRGDYLDRIRVMKAIEFIDVCQFACRWESPKWAPLRCASTDHKGIAVPGAKREHIIPRVVMARDLLASIDNDGWRNPIDAILRCCFLPICLVDSNDYKKLNAGQARCEGIPFTSFTSPGKMMIRFEIARISLDGICTPYNVDCNSVMDYEGHMRFFINLYDEMISSIDDEWRTTLPSVRL